ncbi:MAG: extracellular solute-binding protein [Thermoleophilia bacterium]|nr:extracellular solute-binding protein [Thermoleophilia bacterium]
MRTRYLLIPFFLVLALALASCSGGAGQDEADDGGKLVIYSGRKENLIKPVINAFEEQSGVKVTLLAGGASELANQIIEEQNNPRADVYISNDAGTLGYLALQNVLQSYESEATNAVPDDLKADDGAWVGASIRARVIMYNSDLVTPADLPDSIFDLADPKWKGQFGMTNSASEALTGHVSALRILKGDDFTEQFLRDLKNNDPLLTKSHGEIRKAVGSGEIKLGLVNHYYYHHEKDEGSPVGVIYADQGPDDIGTVLNVAGIAIVKGARNQKAAEAFVEFVLGREAQEIFAGENKEAPVISAVPTVDARPPGTYKQASVPLGQLGKELDQTLAMLEKVGI